MNMNHPEKVNSHAPCHAAKWPTGKYETGDEKQRKLVKYPTSARACPMDLCAGESDYAARPWAFFSAFICGINSFEVP